MVIIMLQMLVSVCANDDENFSSMDYLISNHTRVGYLELTILCQN